MELEGFWEFITIIIVSVIFIFMMTRDSPKITADDDESKKTVE